MAAVITPSARAAALDLLAFIDASPSPWHAVASVAGRLQQQGYRRLAETERWQLQASGRYWVERGGSVVAFAVGDQPLAESGFRIVGAHTDSPGLRLKPKPAQAGDGLLRLAVEVYGGPILATFSDRDLSLAGRAGVRTAAGVETRLLRWTEALARLPNLAIHMNRTVNEDGLKLNKQTELPLLLSLAGEGDDPALRLQSLLAENAGVDPADLLSFELCAHDAQEGRVWGAQQEFIASRQLDNLASCHAGLSALLRAGATAATAVCALFDHEEVGSESAAGAGGSFIADVLGRICANRGLDPEDLRRALARSQLVSADMAHAYHPNFPAAYEPGHKVLVNGGPVLKINASQRYATGADGAARFLALCRRAGVPCQQYAHRSDLGCGSTIGPIVAARLGICTVDVGSPMWAMHSARESAGVADHLSLIDVLTEHFRS